MIVALAFCAKNKDITVRLMHWLSELGWLDKHDCILGVHADTDSSGVIDVAQRLFKRVKEFTIDDPETIYPFIANVMWKRCAYFIADINDASKESQPWFWLEPDAVPLVPEWLDWIEAEYKRAGKPFLLDKVVTPTSTHNSGTGVYPPRVRDYTHQLWNLSNVPWDVFFANDFTPHTMHTTLIHDKFYAVWDDPKSGEPTFPDAASLAQIESGAVIFHRNKDGSLIARLRESRGNKVFRDANAGACVPQPTQAVVAREAISQAPTEGSNPSAPAIDAQSQATVAEYALQKRISELEERVRELEAMLRLGRSESTAIQVEGKGRVWCENKGNRVVEHKVPVRKKKQRTVAEQAAIDARMANLRARKKKLTGVL